MLNVRKAQSKDIERLLELLLQVNLVHHNGRPDIFNVGTKYTNEQLEMLLKDESKPILVATDENDYVLGYAFTIVKEVKNDNILANRKWLYIDDICVDEKYRCMHVGTALYEKVKNLAEELDCYSITLMVWELNPTALKFYQKMGLIPLRTEMEMVIKK